MIVVDSSVWIDALRGTPTLQAEHLKLILEDEVLIIPNLVLVEVLQGCRTIRQFELARTLLGQFIAADCGGHDLAIQAARNYRRLRELGVTVRKTVDTLIATYCIEGGYKLLYSDRDFDPFVEHLGLEPALTNRLS